MQSLFGKVPLQALLKFDFENTSSSSARMVKTYSRGLLSVARAGTYSTSMMALWKRGLEGSVWGRANQMHWSKQGVRQRPG